MTFTPINATNITNIGSVYGMFRYIHSESGGMFFGLIMIGIGFVMAYNLSKSFADTERGIIVASTICTFVSMVLLSIGLINILFVFFFILLASGTTIYKKFGGD